MPSTYSPDLRIELIANGEQSGTWGATTNNNLGTLIEDAISGAAAVSVTSAAQALTAANGAADEARCAALVLTTTTTADFSVFAPPVTKLYVIFNNTAYNASIYCSTVLGNTTPAGAAYVIPAGKTAFVRTNGTVFTDAVNRINGALTLGSALGVGSGGLGLTTIPARSIPVANTLDTYTTVSPAAGQSIRVNAGNTAWEAFTPGIVTGVTASSPIASSGGAAPNITLNSGYGDTQNPYAVKTANTLLAGPTTGAAAPPTFRALVTDDLPTVPVSKGGTNATSAGITAFNNITGYTASGATGTTSTNLVFSTSPSLTTPALSAPTFSTSASITAGTNAQGQGALTADYNVITTAASNPSGVTLPAATTGRKVIVVNKGANTVNVYPASGGAIDALATNASISLPANAVLEFNAASTTLWYSSVNFLINTSALTGSQTANTVFAAPDGLAGNPTFRTLVANDLPTVPVNKGGTGQTSYTDGQLLIGNSTGNTLTKATLTAGSGISITNGSGAITIATTGTSGVTAVTASSPLASSGGTAPNISLSGTVGVANGGTGLTSTPSNGQIDIGNGSGFTRTTLNAGSGISITNGAGAITITATGGAVSSVTGSGAISASPTTGSVVVSVADASSGASGVVNTSTQTFGGNKTFNGSVNVNGIVSTTGAYNFTALNESIYGSAGSVSVSVGGAGRTTVTTAAYTPFTDGLITLGTGAVRWGQIYSTSGTINTSDANTKQDIADLDDAEKRVAMRVKGLIKKFRFKDAVAEKGTEARIHIGVIAQEVQAAFSAEGLDANRYGMFCSDTWWEREEEVEYKPAAEMRKKVVVYDAPVEGGVQKTRLGVRYDELLAFVIAAV